MTSLPPVEAIAVRLADEGVPLRVIARTLHTPSEQIREQLRGARDSGALIELPKEDWPPGFPRDQRALQLSRMVADDKDAVILAIQHVFHLTSTEVTLFMMLLQSPAVPKSRLGDMVTRTIDVHICNIRRRLAPFNITINTLWGYGYQLTSEARKCIMDHIIARVHA